MSRVNIAKRPQHHTADTYSILSDYAEPAVNETSLSHVNTSDKLYGSFLSWHTAVSKHDGETSAAWCGRPSANVGSSDQ